MKHIRTAEDLARAIETPPDEELSTLLAARAESLAGYSEYDFSDLLEILIVQAGDRLPDVERDYGDRLVAEGLIPTSGEADSRQGFPNGRKSESMASCIGGRDHGISDWLAGGF